ncbi:MAG: hypothetical protein ABS75_32945 [Pelagibacterium sp. SCN 63-23]|nr:MAG: hypothetical protein ABS75_32945 [Pelagibacterium sp. SCN 63-23]
MRFAIIGDTREWSEPGVDGPRRGRPVRAEEVESEAWRRKARLNLDEWRMREYVTGRPAPGRVTQLCREIELAAAALQRMSPIPADYADDVYWPHMG